MIMKKDVLLTDIPGYSMGGQARIAGRSERVTGAAKKVSAKKLLGFSTIHLPLASSLILDSKISGTASVAFAHVLL
jgi:hypothetical protein